MYCGGLLIGSTVVVGAATSGEQPEKLAKAPPDVGCLPSTSICTTKATNVQLQGYRKSPGALKLGGRVRDRIVAAAELLSIVSTSESF